MSNSDSIVWELNESGERLVRTYMLHKPQAAPCNCADCNTVRRAGLVQNDVTRPICCGKEMKWQGDPVLGGPCYECLSCGGRA